MAFDPSTATPVEEKKPKFNPSAIVDTPATPIPETPVEEKKPGMVDRALKVGRESLTGGIYGVFAPEMMQAAGGVVKPFEALPGVAGRGAKLVGTALTAGGEAMKAYRPASAATGLIGGAMGETAGQVVESKYGPGVGAETARLLAATLGPVPVQYLGTKAGGLMATLAGKFGLPGTATAKTVGQLLQEAGTKPHSLTKEQELFIAKKLEDIRGGKSSLDAQKEIMDMLKTGAGLVVQSAEGQALTLEARAASQTQQIIQAAQQKADRIRANARSQSPAVRQIAEAEANAAIQEGQQAAKNLEAETRKQVAQLRTGSGKVTTKTEKETQKAKEGIKQVGEQKQLTDVFEPVQQKTIARQEQFIKDRDVLDKDLRSAQNKIVQENESKGVTLDQMPAYREIDAATRGFDVVTSPQIVRTTDPGVLSFYKRIRDSVINRRYELTPEQAEAARGLGYNVEQVGDRFFRTFKSSFEAADDARRFVGDVFRNPPEGYGAVKGNVQQNMYAMLKKLQEEYVGAAERRALQENWSKAARNLEQFETKAGRTLTEIEEGTANTLKAPAELGATFFGNRTGVQRLIDLTGEEALVKKTASDFAASSLANKDANSVRSWLQNPKNSDFLSHPSLADLKRKIEQYATNLERAEKFGGARSTLAESLRTQATTLAEALPKQTERVLAESQKVGSKAEQKRIQDAAKALELQKKTAKGVVTEAEAEAKVLAKPLTEKAKAIRDEAQKRADTILAGTTDEKRVKDIILGSDKDVWEETSRIILSTPGGKEKFAEAVGQVVSKRAASSLKGAIQDWEYIGRNLITYKLMSPSQVANVEAKLQEIFVTPVDVSQKITMTQRLLRNAIVGYVAPAATRLIE
jgi:hypothetical protein